MKVVFCLMVAIALWLPANCNINYYKEGDYMIAVIIPLTVNGTDGKCTKINPAGVTIAEGIVYGFDQVNSESDFAALRKETTLGYDIRDNCGLPEKTRAHALNFAEETLSKTKPVKAVISEFTNADIGSLRVLSSDDNLVMASYSPDNARLKKTAETADPIKKLISVYPEYSKKISAVVDIVKEFKFKYVYGVASDNDGGSSTMEKLSSKLDKNGICMTKLLVSDVGDVNITVSKIAENPKIRVVVIHCAEEVELALYAEAGRQNLTDLIFITTQNFHNDVNKLVPYKTVIDGMLDIYYKRNNKNFESYMTQRLLPYKNRLWLQALFKDVGGNASCLTIQGMDGVKCADYKDKVKALLVEYAPAAEYAYQAVLALAFAQQKSLKDKVPLLKAISGLYVDIAVLSQDPLVFNSDLSAERSKFAIDNLRAGGAELTNKWLGLWDEKTQMGLPLMSFRKKDVVWKKSSKETPVSECSSSCAPGFSRSFLPEQGKCCWDCDKCANGTVSNITNADKCGTCPDGKVVKPDQSGCKSYKLLYFEWFGGVGAVVIILMVVGVALVLFGLGVFSQNSSHELVVNANYNSLCLFLFALLILIFSPIPLLIKIPTVTSCSAYIIMFNIGISIVLGILLSRSAWVNGFFDDNGELTRGTLGRFPRSLCVALVVILQVVVSIIALKMEMLQTQHNLTEQWDERYHECSSWASSTFWAGFTLNILISVVGNSMSCSSVHMQDNAFELKYVLLCHLMFYMFGIVELVIFFRTNDQHLAGGQAINCILFAYSFFICYAWPKIYAILFKSKGDKLLREASVESEEGSMLNATATSASAGFHGHGIVGVKIREVDD